MVINKRFEVNASRSEVVDKVTGKCIRLEPRLMKLLCIFIENRGQIVKREFIIKQIWDDYPGAGEGLNQAISGLRKLLGDEEKEIIETLPKSGYCFHGTIEEKHIKHYSNSLKTAHILAGILIMIAILFLARYYQVTKVSLSEQLSREEARNIFKTDSAQQAERLKTAGLSKE